MEFAKESVFISAVRAFFKTFAVMLGIGVAIFVIVLALSSVSDTVQTPEKSRITLQPDAHWKQELLAETAPVILKINVTGVIGTGDLKTPKFKQMLIDSREGILAKERVKGILLYINSPGGSAIDSAGIHNLLIDYKKKFNLPIYAFVDGLCASGGMYIATSADKIFATADSTIGSVGVRLGPTFNFSEAMTKVGITSLTLTEGKNKDALNPFRPPREGEADAIKAVIAADYQQFLEAVVKNRPRLSKEKLIEEYGANVFIAKTAQEYGYVDEGDASYDSTLEALVAKAGIEEKTKYQVLQIEPYQSVLRDLAENKNSLLQGKIKHVFPTGTYTDSEMSGQLLYLFEP